MRQKVVVGIRNRASIILGCLDSNAQKIQDDYTARPANPGRITGDRLHQRHPAAGIAVAQQGNVRKVCEAAGH